MALRTRRTYVRMRSWLSARGERTSACGAGPPHAENVRPHAELALRMRKWASCGKLHFSASTAFSLFRAKRGLYSGSSRSVASGCISCRHLNFGSYSFSDSGHIAWCNDVKRHGLPHDQGEHARPIKSTAQLDYAHWEINIRAAKSDCTFLAQNYSSFC